MSNFSRTFALIALILALVGTPAFGQSSQGSVRGIVQDQTRAVIPTATVTLANAATNIELRTTTNEAGIYVFPAVVPGPYRLTAESSGMKKYEATLTVQTQQSHNIEITLVPESTTTVVAVTDVTPLVTTDSQTLGHVLERQRIEQLPLNGRFVLNLLATIPGLTSDFSEGAIRTFGTRMGTHDVSLDGAALTDALYGSGTVARPPSLESIQEFKVENNSSSARFTRQTSIIMTTKGGTNDLHGSLFATNRNNSMGIARARDNFTGTAAHYVRNEYGGTAGGPVWLPKLYNGQNRTFWFFAYEGFRQRQGPYGGFRVPTAAMRQGDFRGLVTGSGTPIKIYNPFQTNSTTFERPQFNYNGQANVIDPSLMSPLWKYFNDVLPVPTLPNVNPLVANNWFGARPDIYNQWTWSARFDHRISDKDNLYIRLTNSDSWRFRNSSGVPTLDKSGNWRYDIAPNKSLAGNYTRSFSATFFTETLFSASRNYRATQTGEPGVLYANKLGLANPNNQVGFPVINNFLGSGNYFQPVNANTHYFNYFILDQNVTKIVGRHELEFGGHFRYDQLNYLPQQQRSAGSVSFRPIATALYDPAVPLRTRAVQNTGHITASAFLGLADYEYRVTKQKYYMRQNEDALYFQDKFKITQRLTLNLGVRWQFSPYPKDKYDIFSSFDTKTMSVVLGNDLETFYKIGATTPKLISILEGYGAKFTRPKDVGLPERLVNNNWFDIGPHLGFAYRAFDGPKSLIIRGGYSTSYFPVPIYGWNDRFRLNMPFTGFYQNYELTAANQSPDGKANYGLVSVPRWIAGKNTTNAIELTNPRGIGPGSDSFWVAYFQPDQPSPRVHDWHLTFEKEFGQQNVMRLGYVGNRATHQDSYDSLNETIPDYVWYMTRKEKLPEGDLAEQLQRPFSQYPYGQIEEWRRDGWSNSNGAVLEFERRYHSGFGFQAFYQLINVAKAAGHGWYEDSMVLPTTSFLPGQVPTDRTERMKLLLYARDVSIPKHEVRWNWLADLPFGKGKPVLGNANRLVDAFIGGWQISGMGRWRSTWFTLPIDNWPTGEKVEFYGHKYPIEDCRSGTCLPGYLLWNGYIPAHQINQPNGIKGVPANYKPAVSPLWPYPADYKSRNAQNDPNYGYYGGNTEFITLKDGSRQEVGRDGYNSLHPFINQPVQSTGSWGMDAALFKSFALREGMRLRVQVDFFNVTNTPGNEWNAGGNGIALTNYGKNDPRQMQLSARFSW